MRELLVDLGERSYPIYLGEGIGAQLPEFMEQNGVRPGTRLHIVADDHVASLHLNRVQEQLAKTFPISASIVPAGESSKSLEQLQRIIGEALQAGLDRNSVIVALGGGVVGDLAGFAAASYMRGIRFVQLPTTILAHDSSVGGKVAVNHPQAKNIIGAFHQPEFVMFDIDLLRTLPEREIRAGFSEVIKHGLIWDRQFATWCDDQAEVLLALNGEALENALYQGCKIKAAVVSEDETEQGRRAILNLGHTIGHALEAVGGYGELLHGEAISIGMAGAAKLAGILGYSAEIEQVTRKILKKFGLPTILPKHYDNDRIMEAMKHDKKFKDGRMVFVIPTDIGSVEINNGIEERWVIQVLNDLKEGA